MDPVWLPPNAPLWFPPVDEADDDGLVAVGGDLSPQRILLAYERGIFPWYEEGLPPLWWSPDPRTVLTAESLHVSRSLARTIRSGRFTVSLDRAFGDVIRGCREGREDATWLFGDMVEAYERLHRMGDAHSVEVWEGTRLVGGLYGVQRGALFAAESMFHRATDASKVAVVAAVRSFFAAGVQVFDVQMTTDHLLSMGAVEWSRAVYVRAVAGAVSRPVGLSVRLGSD
ncbi:MAG: leucyl/phenylalanyl-tRNA--protein transferase [Planctomycetes bacterium]|nr:leucyl/phenylalanyl-tRNA--protein transferase [Planctomycetota bacterium]